MDQRCAAFGAERLGQGIAVLAAGPIIEHHFRAVAAGCFDFHLGCVDGHDDGRGDPQPLRRPGHALRVIAARYADNAARAFFVRKVAQPVPGPADLERADRLQAFRLAPHRVAVDLGFEQRGLRQQRGDLGGGTGDALGGGLAGWRGHGASL